MSDYGRLQEENAALKAHLERVNAEVAELKKPKASPLDQFQGSPSSVVDHGMFTGGTGGYIPPVPTSEGNEHSDA